jgi:hypothetical protein
MLAPAACVVAAKLMSATTSTTTLGSSGVGQASRGFSSATLHRSVDGCRRDAKVLLGQPADSGAVVAVAV